MDFVKPPKTDALTDNNNIIKDDHAVEILSGSIDDASFTF